MKDIVIETIQDYRCDLEKIKKNKLDKTINECDKAIDTLLKNIDDYNIDREYEKFLLFLCKLEKVKNEVGRLNYIINSLTNDLEIFLKIYD